jgi:hypothetical protein
MPPHLDFARPEQKGWIRSRGSSKSRVIKTKVCLRMYFEAFPHTLDSWWLTPFPLPIDPQNKSLCPWFLLFSILGDFCRIFKTWRHTLILPKPLSHSKCLNLTMAFHEASPTSKRLCVGLKVRIDICISFTTYVARSKSLSLRGYAARELWSSASECREWMSLIGIWL